MSKSKPSQGQHGNIIPTPGSIRRKLDDAAGKPKPMSDHGVPDDDTLDKLSRSTVYLMLRNASKGIDRLKAEVAAKDAEIQRLELALSEYECWMRDVIESDACWPKGDTLPTLTRELYDRFLAIRSSGKTFGSGKRGAK